MLISRDATSGKATSELPFCHHREQNHSKRKTPFCTQTCCFTAQFLRKAGLEIKSPLCKKVEVSHTSPEGSDGKMLLPTSLGQPAAPQQHGRRKKSFTVHLGD